MCNLKREAEHLKVDAGELKSPEEAEMLSFISYRIPGELIWKARIASEFKNYAKEKDRSIRN